MSPIHQADPNKRPDAEFVPGGFDLLVVGNEGRLLDARRTPVRVVELCDRTGRFTIEILAFEDAGAQWVVPYEDVEKYQFERAAARNDATRTAEIAAISGKLNRTMVIACPPGVIEPVNALIADQTAAARQWLGEHSTFLRDGCDGLPDPAQREGDPRLIADLEGYMRDRGLWDMEEAFADAFVSFPYCEMIKGYRIVFAEMGLMPYEGKIVRDETLFDGSWSKERRMEHIIVRLAFLRGLMAELGLETVTLYRGMSTDRSLDPPRRDTFVSATFSREVALSFFDAYGESSTGLLQRLAVPVERLFMTYHETAAMNRQFKEAEAVLLADASGSGDAARQSF